MKYYKNTRWNMGKWWKRVKEKQHGRPIDWNEVDDYKEEIKGEEDEISTE